MASPKAFARVLTAFARVFTAFLTSLAILYSALVPHAAAAEQNLPVMGEPADEVLSLREEERIGAGYMREIEQRLPLVKDVQLNEYINNLGRRLTHASSRTEGRNFSFFLIDDGHINAFAIPGGHIGINAGLVLAMQREEQLASVVAHEIAHVTQRHHARAYASSKNSNLGTAATVIAAILIGQASPEAGQAALAAGLAASYQSSINFTRSNEIEADRIGIEILDAADYDDSAMAETFDILRRRNSLNTTGMQIEYLRTHPLDNNRMAEAADRARSTPPVSAANQVEFKLFKARLEVIGTSDRSQLLRTCQSRFRRNRDIGSAYAMALIHHEAGRPKEAAKYLTILRDLVGSQTMVELLAADIDSKTAPSRVEKRLAALSELYPERYSIVEKQLGILDRAHRPGEALAVLNLYLRRNTDPDPSALRELAGVRMQLGDIAGGHEALANYHLARNENAEAARQLEFALGEVAAGSHDELRLLARMRAARGESAGNFGTGKEDDNY
ncbi:MAG: hypothetical protein CSB44_13085 [Gammaproteobacteria bacterium]|nr:MAG: hypothetical protein CSB44_13085 [Gammaproteobacteria bacterium]PIE36653.1 MAG: hypothetical protein CSA54_03815 [Gammaproteobacteria bacterium]